MKGMYDNSIAIIQCDVMSFRINKKSLVGLIFLLLIFLGFFLSNLGIELPFSSSYDEIITLILLVYIVINFRKFNGNDKKILLCLVGIEIIGVVSNVYSGIDRKPIYIILDALAISKTFIAYVGFKNLISTDKEKQDIINVFTPIAKILLIIIFLCGTVSVFYNIGMSKGSRYGVPSYCFIFNQPAHCGLITAFLVGIIFMNRKLKRRKQQVYILMGLMSMLYTTKGMAIIIVGAYVTLSYFMRRKERLKWYHFVGLAVITFFLLGFQIQEYILDTTAPRAKFIINGFYVAKMYFPFGSGLATYGSEIAGRYYSPLYYQLGFSNMNGLRIGYNMYLNDNYMASILGQFGFIGLLFHILELYLIFKTIYNRQDESKCKNFMLSIFVSICSVFVASGVFKSVVGIMLFMLLGMYAGEPQNQVIEYKKGI